MAACVAESEAMGKVLVLLIDDQGTVGGYEKNHGKGTNIPHAWSGRLIDGRRKDNRHKYEEIRRFF